MDIIDRDIKKQDRSLSGSIALEASCVVPFFLWFIMTLLMSIEAVRLQSNVLESLYEGICTVYDNGLSLSGTGTAQSYMEEQDHACLIVKGNISYEDASTVSADGILYLKAEYRMMGNIGIRDGLYGHAFTGYVRGTGFETSEATEDYVYVTETGTKYHCDPDCSYIRIRPMAVDASYLEDGRNRSGGKYYPCERCRPSGTGMIFLTPEGDRYHSDPGCSSLKRTVHIMTLKEAVENGYTPCSKCG